MKRRDAIKRAALVSGFAFSGSMASVLLQGCTEEVNSTPDWIPGFFSQEEMEQIGAMAETILPRTDTPGAKDVFVDRYIDMIVNNVMSPEQQQQAKEGLATLYNDFEEEGKKAFLKASAEEQLAYMKKAEMTARQIAADTGNKSQPKTGSGEPSIKPFYPEFKQMVLAGYFTSEEVGTKVLAYDPIPGEWIPCGDLQELTGGRLWSL